jgi:hypothetical protein
VVWTLTRGWCLARRCGATCVVSRAAGNQRSEGGQQWQIVASPLARKAATIVENGDYVYGLVLEDGGIGPAPHWCC